MTKAEMIATYTEARAKFEALRVEATSAKTVNQFSEIISQNRLHMYANGNAQKAQAELDGCRTIQALRNVTIGWIQNAIKGSEMGLSMAEKLEG